MTIGTNAIFMSILSPQPLNVIQAVLSTLLHFLALFLSHDMFPRTHFYPLGQLGKINLIQLHIDIYSTHSTCVESVILYYIIQ